MRGLFNFNILRRPPNGYWDGFNYEQASMAMLDLCRLADESGATGPYFREHIDALDDIMKREYRRAA